MPVANGRENNQALTIIVFFRHNRGVRAGYGSVGWMDVSLYFRKIGEVFLTGDYAKHKSSFRIAGSVRTPFDLKQ